MNAHWPLADSFRLRLTMLSDWHVGSGAGRPGNIDRLIVRDADGLPFVPAKTLGGIWRDACERLARGLDDGQAGEWSRLVDRLFGSQPALGLNDPTHAPLASALSVRPARLPEDLRRRVAAKKPTERQQFVEAMTFVKPGVKIDRRSGRAQTDFLRFEEMARVGTVLEAGCTLALPAEELRQAASAVLLGGAKLVERLGGKRRRGPGRCILEVPGAEINQALEWLAGHEKPPPWMEQAAATSSVEITSATASDSWVVVPLVLRLTGPVAVSYRTVGNVVETLDFLPGSYLLPHVTRVLREQLAVDPRPAIQRGDLCVLPAMLEVAGQRGQPTPMALFADKNDAKRLINRLMMGEPAEGQYKQLRTGYVAPGLAPTTVPLVMRTHNTVEDGRQRPTSDVGGVYTYEAIAPADEGRAVRLRSELRLRKSLADQLQQRRTDWWKGLDGNVSLGRSKKDDYGEVQFEAEQPSPFVPTSLDGRDLVVEVLSDTLLRDDDLRPAPTAQALAVELSQRLGAGVSVRESKTDGRLDELVRVRRLDTWHVGWGLPRPSLVALQAGSCIALELQHPVDPARLAEVEAGGVGERTAEGYGQLSFSHPLLTTSPVELALPIKEDMNPPSDPRRLPALDFDHPDYASAHLLEGEVWKQHIRRAALGIAADRTRRENLLRWNVQRDQPPMSQLGGLRGQVSQLRGDADAQLILAWLDHLARNKRRSEKWPNGAIEQIRRVLQDASAVWTELQPREWPTLTPAAPQHLHNELWALAVRTLIDACIRAHKRELETRGGNHGA